ncbi:MAG: hypothetical protein JXN64_06295 [Spirochaetes bacterium]|nr:hypothetical protein [Spirochaetota bacterium]
MALDSYLVKIGVKGQDVVLSVMDKIQKKGKDLSKKKTTVTLAAKTTAEAKTKTEELAKKTSEKESKRKDEESKKDKKNTSKFGKSVDKFGNTTANLSRSMSDLDPASAIHSGLSELSKIAIAGIPFAIAGAALATATKTISMAKAYAGAQYGLTQRNAAAKYYGEKVSFKTDKWSNEEMAMLRTGIGQSYGKIQQPLADAISEFTKTNKYDPTALMRVASGNWRSTGTDRGWILQQMTDSLGDLPPTIAQKFQAALLKRYGAEEIQKTTKEQREAQTMNAAWANRNEQQINEIFGAITRSAKELLGLNNQLNQLQVKMVSAGTSVATGLNFVANQIEKANNRIRAGK